MVSREDVIDTLRSVLDPDLGIDIVRMGMVGDVSINENEINCEIVLTTPACPVKSKIESDVEYVLKERFGSDYKINVTMKSKVVKAPENPTYKTPVNRIINLDNIKDVKNIIAVYSCKGGVGKTTVSVNLALSLAKYGSKVGLLDLDLHGPNIPIMLGLVGQPKIRNSKIVPPEIHGIKVLSVGLLTDDSSPIIWRGPIQTTAVKQLFEDVGWGDLDYLVLDLPPGTGDIQITLSQNIPISGIVMVSTPQLVAVIDTVKGVNMFEKMGVPILGMVLNMAYLACEHCGEKNYIFPRADINKYLENRKLDILGEIPLSPRVAELSDKGTPIVYEDESHFISKIYMDIASKVASILSTLSMKKALS
ncbi:MAG: P-loop NTPase [Spirochaetia bacterium]|nr:Mrp/NBP35 family ATP-binding protein [Spirochaetota bacterium]MCX8096165.1 Mrp/NBP35 family ATP-binding protein [Spirochaetota bacterium]MDW8113007.1 P-loop NTPase [Spirochaetia bacterium]